MKAISLTALCVLLEASVAVGSPPEPDSPLFGAYYASCGPGVDEAVGIRFPKTGVGIVFVVPGGTADKAGVMLGDCIYEVNRKPISGSEAFRRQLESLAVGSKLHLAVYRDVSGRLTPKTLNGVVLSQRQCVENVVRGDGDKFSDSRTFRHVAYGPNRTSARDIRLSVTIDGDVTAVELLIRTPGFADSRLPIVFRRGDGKKVEITRPEDDFASWSNGAVNGTEITALLSPQQADDLCGLLAEAHELDVRVGEKSETSDFTYESRTVAELRAMALFYFYHRPSSAPRAP